jgi:hypothetical protein
MTTTELGEVAFHIEFSHFSQFSGQVPESVSWNEVCESLGLSSEQRIFYALSKSLILDTHVFSPGREIAKEGDGVYEVHVIQDGYVTVKRGDSSYRVGSGGVFGLAEGILRRPHMYTVIAEGLVTTNSITMAKVALDWPNVHKGLKGIERSTIIRILRSAGITEEVKV